MSNKLPPRNSHDHLADEYLLKEAGKGTGLTPLGFGYGPHTNFPGD